MAFPDLAGCLFGVGQRLRLGVQDAGEVPAGPVSGPARVAGGDEADPCFLEFAGERDGLGSGLLADELGADGAVQRAERQGNVEAVSGTQDAAEGRGSQAQFEQV